MGLTYRVSQRLLTKALVLSVAVAFCSAQSQKAQNDRTTFRSNVEAVTVAAVVTDRAGKHIQGLKAGDFVIEEEGKPQRITSVEEFVSSPSVPRSPSAGNNYSNRLVTEGDRGRITVILLDLLNANLSDQSYARNQAVKFLLQWDASEPVALATLSCSGLKIAHDFTQTPQELIAALKAVKPNAAFNAPLDIPEVPAYASFLNAMGGAFQGGTCGDSQRVREITIGALGQVTQSLAGFRGRKALIWLTAGVPLPSDPRAFLNLPSLLGSEDFSANTEQIDWRVKLAYGYRALADANIAIYPVDVKGLIARAPVGGNPLRPTASDPRSVMDDYRIDQFKEIAETTGGKAFYRGNDLAKSMQRAVEDSSAYYLVTYHRDTKTDEKPGWRRLKVQVTRPGTQVRARSGFFLTGPVPARLMRQNDLSLATYSALDLTGVPIDIELAKTMTPKGARVDFNLRVPANAVMVDAGDGNHIVMDWLIVVLKNEQMIMNHGKTLDVRVPEQELAELRANGLTYKSFVTIPPESAKYSVRFVARDGISGRIGSVTVPADKLIADK